MYHHEKLTDYSQCSFQSRDRQENPFHGRGPAASGYVEINPAGRQTDDGRIKVKRHWTIVGSRHFGSYEDARETIPGSRR